MSSSFWDWRHGSISIRHISTIRITSVIKMDSIDLHLTAEKINYEKSVIKSIYEPIWFAICFSFASIVLNVHTFMSFIHGSANIYIFRLEKWSDESFKLRNYFENLKTIFGVLLVFFLSLFCDKFIFNFASICLN